MTDRTTARVVGGLFITATVAGVLSVLSLQSVIGADDYLAEASLNENRVATGALLEIIMSIAIVGIAIVLYPVLKRYSERLALGYVIARTIEVTIFAMSTFLLLTLVTGSHEFVDAGAPGSSHHQTMGELLLAGRDWFEAALVYVAFSLSALILNYVLYQARLLPRWLSTWGLVGAALYLTSGVMVLYGLEPFSTTQQLLTVPLAVQEMVFAIWLIARGFNATAFAPEP